ncbi:MAG: hypothetical protein NC200_06640 [Candidatus Gastranaerophilales bacterium]|nr:hypothetical protein [Candidatus Gastranaerophilales bacterium]
MLTVQQSQTNTQFRGDKNHRPQIGQKVKDNSTEITVGGGAGLATFGTLSNSSKIGNNVVRAIKTSKKIKLEKQAQLLELCARFKPFARFANNPIVKKAAGGLAGLSAITTLAGSSAKIVDTCGYLRSQNPNA